MIKAIKTVYNGYKFRSRLEARWAVFFDTLNIKYQYEVEGFDLDGIWYLPDFYLPDTNNWIEIKPTLPNDDEKTKILKLYNTLNEKVFRRIKKHGFENNYIQDCTHIICGTPWFPKFKVSFDDGINIDILDGYIILSPNSLFNLWHVKAFKGDKNNWDIWPIYLTETDNDIINLKDRDFTQGEHYCSLGLPYNIINNIYVGSGDSYSTRDLKKAYVSARQARF